MDPTYHTMVELLRAVQKALDEAGVGADVRPVAFGKAFEALIAGPSRLGRRSGPNQESGKKDAGEPNPIDSIATKFKLTADVVREVFSVGADSELTLIVPVSKLEKAKSAAAKQIALLIASARQAAGVDTEWTSVEVFRSIASDYGKYDAPNFATTIGSYQTVFSFRGKGQQRHVRVNRQGFDEAAHGAGDRPVPRGPGSPHPDVAGSIRRRP